MDMLNNGPRPRKVYTLDEATAERIVRLANRLAEAIEVMIFNREKVINATDEFERRLCGELRRDIEWAKLDDIF